jgi:TldD protein
MRDRITQALKSHGADYVEIRIEESETTRIQYRGRELEEIGRTTELGGNVRALVRGGWGFVSFNDLRDLKERVALAVRQARLVGEEVSLLAEVESMVDIVPAELIKDPREVPLAEKKRLLDEYNGIIWGLSPQIQTSLIRYGDTYKRLYFCTSEGSYIEQEKVDVRALFLAVAREDGNIQRAHLSLGSIRDYGVVEGLHERIEETARRAVRLLSARPIKGGTYTVVADPMLAGVFVHEAFGHLSEADHVYENERLRELMVLGRRFGGEHLNIVDGAAVPDLRGSYQYDDEGVPAGKSYLIQEGVLVGRLHSRETAGKMGEQPTGNARAINYRFPPLVRMTNTYIEPGDVSFEEMIGDIEEGVYAKDSTGGQTSMEMFTFVAGEAYMIRHGQIAEPLRGVSLSGNVFETLAHIEAIGDDLSFHQGGGCGKGEQSPLPVSDGSPHIRIRNVVIGGE